MTGVKKQKQYQQLLEWRRAGEFDLLSRLAAIEVIKGIVALREEVLGNGQIISEANKAILEKSSEINRIRGEAAKIHADTALALDEMQRLGLESSHDDQDQSQTNQSKENNDNQKDKLVAIQVIRDIVALREEVLANGQIISEANRIAAEKSSEINRILGEAAKIQVDTALAINVNLNLNLKINHHKKEIKVRRIMIIRKKPSGWTFKKKYIGNEVINISEKMLIIILCSFILPVG